ncbi:hypothetical protein [Novipirellula aureliae]|uniref:hypothetical protein n=1 Tax=Novipirellula aureliae TaxID=2527966 RepID=UPI001E5C0EA1|nr:hypothetical protein [Novipirellula aureliae]
MYKRGEKSKASESLEQFQTLSRRLFDLLDQLEQVAEQRCERSAGVAAKPSFS